MEFKKCARCTRQLRPSGFYRNRRRPDGLATWCKQCTKGERANYYARNRKSEISKAYKRTVTKRTAYYAKVDGIKGRHGCCVCSEKDPTCLDFHHIDRSTKLFSIGHLTHGSVSWSRIVAEMMKCAVLCVNCHRKHHAGTLPIGRLTRVILEEEDTILNYKPWSKEDADCYVI